MGNFQNKENINLANEIDYIAANYILNNKDAENVDLTKDTECLKLVEKVATLLKKNLNGLQSNYLLQTRIQASSTTSTNTKEAECNTIAKFYVKIANIFAAITTSVYRLEQAQQAQAQAKQEQLNEQAQKEQAQAPEPLKEQKYYGQPYNFCSERLKNLLNGQDYSKVIDDKKKEMIIQPNVCNMNKSKKNEINNLAIEPGITELHKLYYDEYDSTSGEFTKMSPEMKKVYKNDVRTFYKSFYGDNVPIPENIDYFSDITLTDYAKDNSGCTTNGIYTVPYKGVITDNLFKAYATHIKEMELRTTKNQNKLLKVLDELFMVVKKDNEEGNIKKTITLNPDLNDRKLQRLAQTTREFLMDLFITCEKDYKDGIKLYQQIVDNQLKNIIPIKKRVLRNEMNVLMASSFIAPAPAPTPPAQVPVLAPPVSAAQGQAVTPRPPAFNPAVIPLELQNAEEYDIRLRGGNKAHRKIAYDFDGVIHTYVGKSNADGQRAALSNNPETLIKHHSSKIIKQIKEYFTRGYTQYILSARIDTWHIINILRKLQITAEMIPDENVLSAWSDVKWKTLQDKGINEFYDDSCITIYNVQKNRKELPQLDKLYLVFPEKSKWVEIERNAKIDLQTCMQLK